jgi:hypothetical protein
MALNMLYKYSATKTQTWPVPSGTVAGQPVVSITNEPGVALTSRGDARLTVGSSTGTQITEPGGGVGNIATEATVARDGTFILAVTGVTSATPKNTQVYAVVSGGAVTSLTTTVGSNPLFGKVVSALGQASASAVAVEVGVFQ